MHVTTPFQLEIYGTPMIERTNNLHKRMIAAVQTSLYCVRTVLWRTRVFGGWEREPEAQCRRPGSYISRRELGALRLVDDESSVMAAGVAGERSRLDSAETAMFGGVGCAPCRMPWRSRVPPEQHSGNVLQHLRQYQDCSSSEAAATSSRSVASVVKVFVVNKSRLRFEPSSNLVFLYEPGKQVASAVKIRNVSRSPVAFKFQTTAPKSCFMCPPNGIIQPNDTIFAKVVKFVEAPEGEGQQQPTKLKDKFRIISVKVKEGVEYTPELFDDQKELVAVERVLRVVFLDPQTASPAELEKQQKRLAEADAAQEARKKPEENKTDKGSGVQAFVIDEWKERREKYLARQQAEAQDSL